MKKEFFDLLYERYDRAYAMLCSFAYGEKMLKLDEDFNIPELLGENGGMYVDTRSKVDDYLRQGGNYDYFWSIECCVTNAFSAGYAAAYLWIKQKRNYVKDDFVKQVLPEGESILKLSGYALEQCGMERGSEEMRDFVQQIHDAYIYLVYVYHRVMRDISPRFSFHDDRYAEPAISQLQFAMYRLGMNMAIQKYENIGY